MNKTDKIIEILKKCSNEIKYKSGLEVIMPIYFPELAQKINQLFNDWPKDGDEYFLPAATNEDFYGEATWRNDGYDQEMMARGLVFRTKEEAIEAAKKMLNSLK